MARRSPRGSWSSAGSAGSRALIVGADALVGWCSWLLDQGYRGEMECTVAKVFGSEAQKEAAIELFMKTHGGRAFLHGHLFGDNVHEYLAPCIYEGEGEMLGMGFFKSLIKDHGKAYFEPIGRPLQAAGIRSPNPINPAHAWALRNAAMPLREVAGDAEADRLAPPDDPADAPTPWPSTPQFAADQPSQRSRLEVSGVMMKHQLKLADRQCRMAELSQRLQDLVVILATCAAGPGQQPTGLVQEAADILCQDLTPQAHRQAADRRLLPRHHPARRGSPTAASRPRGVDASEPRNPHAVLRLKAAKPRKVGWDFDFRREAGSGTEI